MQEHYDELTGTAPVAAYGLASGASVAEGDMVSLNGSAQIVKAGDTSATSFAGVAGRIVDGGVQVADGVLRLPNSAVSSSTLGRADRGKPCYCLGSNTVGKVTGLTNKIPAGIVIDVDSDGVWVDARPAAKAAALALTVSSTNL